MKNLNDRNSRKYLVRLIHTNFKEGDLYLTFTYSNKYLPNSIYEAENNIRNFIRRINYRRKKVGLDNAKYIFITEYSDEKKIRVHHHLLMDCGLSMDIVDSMWKFGRREIRRIEPDEDESLTALANYLSKDPKGKKRWIPSNNLKKPKERKSYTVFRNSHIKKMIQDNTYAQKLTSKKYKNMVYISEEIRFNEINGQFYIYIRMREKNERSNK